MKSGCSTAGCYGDEVSWEMQVGKQARHHYCPVGGGRIIKHPPSYYIVFCIISLLSFGTLLASVVLV